MAAAAAAAVAGAVAMVMYLPYRKHTYHAQTYVCRNASVCADVLVRADKPSFFQVG